MTLAGMTLSRVILHGLIALGLTALTQVGGLVWIASRLFRRPLLAFVLAYALVWALVQVTAPLTGRVALPCRGEVLRSQSALYCALLRNFVTPELKALAEEAAAGVAGQFPGTVTLTLDAGFPFGTGFPLLPHLSHDDGEKLDLAFYYQGHKDYEPGKTRSPLGYFAFEALEAPETCPEVTLTLRWRLDWAQPPTRDLWLEPQRTTALLRILLADARVGRVFVEPPLAKSLGLSDDKLRFQGCRAARHDDHIHVQL